EVPFESAAGNPTVAHRGAAYGLPGIEVDGNDVLAVHAIASEAIRRARTGGGPTLVECKTYRTRPHAEGMGDYTYRSREEVEEWKTRCPIRQLRQRLLCGGESLSGEGNGQGQPALATALDAIDAEVAQFI